MKENIQMEEEYVITDLETLKIASDPLRVRIIELFALASEKGGSMTVKELAEQIEMPPTKLYYHVKLLEEHSLIQVVDTQVVSGIIEKHYQLRARSITVDERIFSVGGADQDEGLELLFTSTNSVFKTAQKEFESSYRLIAQQGIDIESLKQKIAKRIGHTFISLTPEQSFAFQKRLSALLNEFKEIENASKDGALVYGFTFAFVPYFHLSDEHVVEGFKEQ
jgi:DNA-binding transcriptional ArsR family regulator